MPDPLGVQSEGPGCEPSDGLTEQLWRLRAITEVLFWREEHNGGRSTVILFYFPPLSSTGTGW